MKKLFEILNKNISFADLSSFCGRRLLPSLNALLFWTKTAKHQFVTFLNTSHFLTIAVSLTVATAVFLYSGSDLQVPVQNMAVASIPLESQAHAALPPAVIEPAHNYIDIVGELAKGETLSTSFKRAGVSDDVRLQVIRSFEGVLDFRDLRPRDRFTVTVDDDGLLVKCLYESGPLDIHAITRNEDGSYHAEKQAVPLEVQTVKVAGSINSSLFAAFLPFNEDPKLIYTFADIFASKIDFNTETRSGDRFELVFEKYYKNGAFVGYGNILVARFDSQENGLLEGFYYTAENGIGSYYDVNGNELGASFIKSPVPMGRISSRFSYRRRHPVLKTVRPHLGVDLAAPVGTPIMAAADGRVSFVGWKGGFGKQIILDHGAGYRTYYGHLSSFRKGLKNGARVRQKQIIGYVGSTGISTGPHLDYRLSQNGKFMNPFGIKFKPRSVLSGEALAQFRIQAGEYVEQAKSLDDPKIILVKNIVVTPETRISLL